MRTTLMHANLLQNNYSYPLTVSHQVAHESESMETTFCLFGTEACETCKQFPSIEIPSRESATICIRLKMALGPLTDSNRSRSSLLLLWPVEQTKGWTKYR